MMNHFNRIFALAILTIALSTCKLFTPTTVWIDVRSLNEYNEDHINNTEHIPHTEIATRIDSLSLKKSTPIKLFCRSGKRAGLAQATLQDLGYSNVENVGGIDDAREVLFQSEL